MASNFRRNAEAAQKRYREERGIQPGSIELTRGTSNDRRRERVELDYLIPKEVRFQSENFLSTAAYEAALDRAGMEPGDVKPKDKGVAYDRTFFNMLSSQAMCFNIFGTLARVDGGLELLSACLAELLPPVHTVTRLELEHAPSGNPFKDQGAYGVDCDVYLEYNDANGDSGVIAMETKFVEPDFSTCGHRKAGAKHPCPEGTTGRDCVYRAVNKFEYWETSDRIGNLPDGSIDSPCRFGDGKWQLWTNHTLAYSEAGAGRAPALYVVCAPHANDTLLSRDGDSTLDRYRDLVADADTVRTLWVEDLVAALERNVPAEFPERTRWLQGLRERYCGLGGRK